MQFSIVERLMRHLIHRSETLATAESCTGGILATWFTELPGSSKVYLGGVSSYSNDAKQLFLSVPAKVLELQGAVSQTVAELMAESIQRRLLSSYAVSITGIAGPEGGSAEKPVGTVWCAVSGPGMVTSRKYHFSGTRTEIREQAALAAIDLVAKASGLIAEH